MELESVFLDSKWSILVELSQGPLSPTELAKRTKTSIANISTQLRLLEALDFVEKEKLNNVGKGQPRKLYGLKKEYAYLILGTKFMIGKKLIKLDPSNMPFFNIWFLHDSEAPYIFLKLYLEYEKQFLESSSFGFVGLKDNEIEILMIHQESQSIQFLNERHITRLDKTFRVRAHIHSKEAYENGIKNKEDYFLSLIKKAVILSDKDNFLSKLKKGGK
jgi:hypothetical protein